MPSRDQVARHCICLVVNEAGAQLAQGLVDTGTYRFEVWSHQNLGTRQGAGTGTGTGPSPSFKDLVARAWLEADALVFFGATGIAVRAIAPLVGDKFKDPSVVVVDVAGAFAISLLSGHVGGGNGLTELVAQQLGARPVITTATDALGAQGQGLDLILMGLGISPRHYREPILKANAALLRGERIAVILGDPETAKVVGEAWDFGPAYEVVTGTGTKTGTKFEDLPLHDFALALWLSREPIPIPVPKPLKPLEAQGLVYEIMMPRVALGLGFKAGKPVEDLEEAIAKALDHFGVDERRIGLVATIERKAVEPGFKSLMRRLKVPYKVVALEAIRAVEGAFEGSDFVEKTLGVRAVSEPCALLAARGMAQVQTKVQAGGTATKIHLSKRFTHQGVTVALAWHIIRENEDDI